jgi:hypothetical protein
MNILGLFGGGSTNRTNQADEASTSSSAAESTESPTSSTGWAAKSTPVGMAREVASRHGSDFVASVEEGLKYDGKFAPALEQIQAKVEKGELSEDDAKKIKRGISSQMGITSFIKNMLQKLMDAARKKFDFVNG